MSHRFAVVLAAGLLLGAAVPAGAVTVLMVGGGATPSSGADLSIFSLLQGRYGGANVTYKQASAANNTTDLVGIDVLVASSTVASSDVRNKYHDSAVGIVNMEEAVMDDGAGEFGLSDVAMTKSTTTTQLSIAMAHPITAGLAGTINFTTTGETLSTTTLAGSAFSLASAADGTGAGNSALFAVDTGGTVGVSSPAEGRRVMFPITDSTFNNLTAEGRQLFAQSVDWAADAVGFVAPVVLAQYTFPTTNTLETGAGYAATTVDPRLTAGDVSATASALDTTIEELGYATAPALRVFPAGNTSLTAAVANNGYFEFTLTPKAGENLDLTSIMFDAARGGGSTPRGWGLATSLDNFATVLDSEDIGSQRPTWTSYFVDLSGAQFQNLAGPLTFRMYVYSPTDGSTVEFDNITVRGPAGVAAVPEPASGLLALCGVAGLALRRRRAA